MLNEFRSLTLDHAEWPAFCDHVRTNMGDVVVLDGEYDFISQKIRGYWQIWLFCKFCNDMEVPLTGMLFYRLITGSLAEPEWEEDRDVVSKGRIQRYLQLWKFLGGK
jgi:hypothetical protein